MAHKVFIRHTYIYKCADKGCAEEWKINERVNKTKLKRPDLYKKHIESKNQKVD